MDDDGDDGRRTAVVHPGEVVSIPKRIITTWICDRERDRYSERHREILGHCVQSWTRVMPDYEIVLITMGNVAQFGLDPWVERCIETGNFIGVSQWTRLKALASLGGVFLDADVEAVRPFDDLLVDDGLFTLGHLGNGQTFANNAVMASAPSHPFLGLMIRSLLGLIDLSHPDFGNHSGPFMVTNLLRAAGWDSVDRDATIDTPETGRVDVRSSAAFYPYSWNRGFSPDCIRPETLAVHHWASSWKSDAEQTTHAWRSR
jgi:hypothetical protein